MLTRRRALSGLAASAALGVSTMGRAEAHRGAPTVPPFELTAHDGRRIRSDRDFADQPMLVYFGYTYCPDFCPSSLAQLAAALHELEEAGRAPRDLAFLFISIDPQRDTPLRLAEYVKHFHPSLIGATGAPEEIAAIAQGWGVKYGRSEGGTAEEYLMDHPLYGFGLNRRHQIVSRLWHYASPAKLAKMISAFSAP